MPLDADSILDRRRLKRKLTFWRLLTIAVVVAGIVYISAPSGDGGDGNTGGMGTQDHVALLDISGIILEDFERDLALDKIAENNAVKALIVYINSPGGTVVGGEALYYKIREVAAKKPVVTLMGGVAASAGYMIALASEYIFARQGTVTGSIGVLMQTVDMTELLNKIGVKPEIIKSAPLKAQPNPMEPFSSEARKATQNVVMDLYNMFVDMVVERRKMDHDQVIKLADGRIFTGRQAVKNGLVDEIGGEPEARKWLSETYKIDPLVPMKRVVIKRKGQIWRNLFGMVFGKTLFSERLTLDGPISVWQPNIK